MRRLTIALACLILGLVACDGDDFAGPNGVISDHDGYWSGQQQDDFWATESGTFWRISNQGYSEDDLFRTWTYGENYQNVRVTMKLKNMGFLPGTDFRPPKPFDGVKLWLHARHEDGGVLGAPMSGSPAGYTSEVNLRDGRIYVQKKVPGDASQWPNADSCIQNGCYFLLGSPQNFAANIGIWETVGGQARNNSDGTVTISIIRNGVVVYSVTDHGTEGGPPLRGPGRIGLRSDNTRYYVDDFLISDAQ